MIGREVETLHGSSRVGHAAAKRVRHHWEKTVVSLAFRSEQEAYDFHIALTTLEAPRAPWAEPAQEKETA